MSMEACPTPIYLDNNATTPLAPEVSSEVIHCLTERWQNPSSGYASGKKAKEVVERARKQVREALGGEKDGGVVTFTSGGTESNHLAIYCALESFRLWNEDYESQEDPVLKPHIVTTDVEHVAVELPIKQLVSLGKIEATFVPVDRSTGAVSAQSVQSALKPNTVLVSVMMANNETGVVNPVYEIGEMLERRNHECGKTEAAQPRILFHSDGAQALGKIRVDVRDMKVDYFTIVGHKFYGPRNGALYISPTAPTHPLLLGGGQESGLRSGTENTPMVAGLGVACELAARYQREDFAEMAKLRDWIMNSLVSTLGPDVVTDNFSTSPSRLPNTLSVSFKHLGTGSELLEACQGRIEASTTSACHTGGGGVKAPKVLVNSGVGEEEAIRTIRLSVGRFTTKKDVEKAAEVIEKAYKSLVQRQ